MIQLEQRRAGHSSEKLQSLLPGHRVCILSQKVTAGWEGVSGKTEWGPQQLDETRLWGRGDSYHVATQAVFFQRQPTSPNLMTSTSEQSPPLLQAREGSPASPSTAVWPATLPSVLLPDTCSGSRVVGKDQDVCLRAWVFVTVTPQWFQMEAQF